LAFRLQLSTAPFSVPTMNFVGPAAKLLSNATAPSTGPPSPPAAENHQTAVALVVVCEPARLPALYRSASEGISFALTQRRAAAMRIV